MSHTLTIAKREVTSLFYSPIAYVVLGLFSAIVTLIFFSGFAPGMPATMRATNEWVVWLMIFLLPAISMRLLSEEYRSGTVEMLMTSPVSDAAVVVGKWLGAMAFFLVLLVPMLVLIGVLAWFSDLEAGPIVTGLIGLICVAGVYLAIGTFASAASENQIICFLLTVFIIGMMTITMWWLSGQAWLPALGQKVVKYVNVVDQFRDLNKGLIDLSDLIYFGTTIALFLFMAVKFHESRRWR